ncbi:MAG: response regulator, partial [Chloroflexi bacterium]|nr:response regulator [Chloroflexota bacterium]
GAGGRGGDNAIQYAAGAAVAGADHAPSPHDGSAAVGANGGASLADGDGPAWVQLGSERVRIERLDRLLRLPPADAESEAPHAIPLVVAGSRDDRLALAVDRIVGEREVVVKPVPWPAVPGSIALGVAVIEGLGVDRRSGDDRATAVLVLDMAQIARLRRAAVASAGASETGSGRVLVVDDSLTIRRALSALLAHDGWVVDTARDGAEALEVIANRRPDLCIVDVEMPRLDGFQFLAIVRRQPSLRALPVIILTSRSDAGPRERAARLGVDRYLLKPYRPQDVLGAVHSLAAEHHVRDARGRVE